MTTSNKQERARAVPPPHPRTERCEPASRRQLLSALADYHINESTRYVDQPFYFPFV